MIVDGKAIASDIIQQLAAQQRGADIRLQVIVVGSDPATQSFIRIKKKAALAAGIEVAETRLPEDVSQADLEAMTLKIASLEEPMIVQLPLPEHIDRDAVLAHIPLSLDVDMLSVHARQAYAENTAYFHPPVVGAIIEILGRARIELSGKKVLIIGEGLLVGAPAHTFFARQEGVSVSVANKEISDLSVRTKKADVIISGAGVASMITPEMIEDGVVLLDAGTSEAAGEIRGDADPACAAKASLFTPVPGGIGPVTTAVLLRNAVAASKLRRA